MNAPASMGESLDAGVPVQASGQSSTHDSAALHVTGAAAYVDDLPELPGTLHCAPVLSSQAHARLKSLDLHALRAMPGVVAVITAADLASDNRLGAVLKDEPILPADTVEYLGQPIAIVVAESVKAARTAARQAVVGLEPLLAILEIDQALAARSWVLPPAQLVRGDPDAALQAAPHRLGGRLRIGGQEQFYLEGQIAYALPQEGGAMKVYSSTQHPSEVQHWVAHALGLPSSAVSVECRRMGGGFGGKETQAGHVAVWAALAADATGRPCKLRLDRDDDFLVTGKRHDFRVDYEAGFDADGRIRGLRLQLASRCGFSADLSGPVNDRAMFHCDNAYFLEHVAIDSFRCKTHTQSSTAFRGFGGPQGMLAIEEVLDAIARHLGLDPLDVRLANLYGPAPRHTTPYGMAVEDNIAPALMAQLEQDADYRRRRAAIEAHNADDPVLRRGLALTPVKFGISFTATHLNQAGALVNVYGDGSVRVCHGGTEMGQGLHTKVLQIVADELGLPLSCVRIAATSTDGIPNASATAASSGTDLNGKAAQAAARDIRLRLADLFARQVGADPQAVRFADGVVSCPQASLAFVELVKLAWQARVQLWSDGFYATPKIHYDRATMRGRPFFYFAYGAAATEVAVDTLTGETRVLRVDILHDVGRSINPAIDRGQIEGGFVQGMGWLTSEELVWDGQGRLATHAPSTYKIPTAGDVPADLRVAFWNEANREDSVFHSKAVGEPPLMLAISVLHAIRDALAGLRPGRPVELDAPATPQAVLFAAQRMRGA
jgi:xanthine dehydrogenase large subunit